MSRQRPGGLTALAVINFVFGAFDGLGFLFGAVRLGQLDKVKEQLAEAGANVPPDWFFFYAFAMNGVLAALLIMSGVGYLKLRKKLGRGVGNVYAVVSILDTVVQVSIGGQFSMFAILLAIYPLLTLIALNLIFKDDFE